MSIRGQINFNSCAYVQPGRSSGFGEVADCEGARETYVFLKLLKSICDTDATSFEIKRVLCDLRKEHGPDFAKDPIRY